MPVARTEVSPTEFRDLVARVRYQARCVGLRGLDAIQFVGQRRPRLGWKARAGRDQVLYIPRAGRTRSEVAHDMVAQVVAIQQHMCTFRKAAAMRTIESHLDDATA